MTIEQIKDVCQATPFQPFRVVTKDGRVIPVRARDMIAWSPSGNSMAIFQFDDSLTILDIETVSNITI